MPQFGTGIIPQAGAVANELTATVRRAFMESVIVQIWQASPLIAALLHADAPHVLVQPRAIWDALR